MYTAVLVQKGGTVSCKKKDVLELKLEEYTGYADALTRGFIEAEKLLEEERIFLARTCHIQHNLFHLPLFVLYLKTITESR